MTRDAGTSAISRRRFLRLTLFAGLGTAAAGGVAGLVAFAYPKSPFHYGGLRTIGADHVPAPGDPPFRSEGGVFWMVDLAPGEGREHADTRPAPGGLIALSDKCPREGCTVPWRASFEWSDGPDPGAARTGWFRCPCCGATFTKAGVRVFGPAPRSMDRYPITVLASGDIVVDTSRRIPGAIDNPRQTTPYRTPSVVSAPARRDTGAG